MTDGQRRVEVHFFGVCKFTVNVVAPAKKRAVASPPHRGIIRFRITRFRIMKWKRGGTKTLYSDESGAPVNGEKGLNGRLGAQQAVLGEVVDLPRAARVGTDRVRLDHRRNTHATAAQPVT